MNELDKLSSPAEDVTRSDDSLENAGTATPESNTVESASDVCAETESPALDIAVAADAAEADGVAESSEPSDASSAERNFHSMSKQELAEALKEILDSGNLEAHKEVALIKQAYYTQHNRQIAAELEEFVAAGNDPAAFSSTPDESEAQVKALLAEFREKRNVFLEEKEEEKKKNLDEKNRIIAELKTIADDIDNINLHFPKFQQLQQDFKNVGEVPAGSDNEVWKNYQSVVEQFYDRLKMNKELRDLDFKKNLELKTLLVEKAEELTSHPDPVEAFKRLQTLHEQWREIGPVAREIREEIWDKFKEASTAINKRHQDFFQARKAAEAENEAAKTALCEKVEAIDLNEIKSFSDWDAKTKEIIALQQEWKGLGFASKKANNALFARFRKACDDFFSTKAEFFKKSKEESKENLQKKEALCEKAEALAENFNEKGALDKMQALQKEWKTVGVVRRKAGDDVWKRFSTAVDAFYAARKKEASGRRDEENENLKIKKGIVEKLAAISEESDRKDVIGTIRELQNEWQQTGHVPFKHKDALQTDYRRELDRLFSAFDLRENRQRMKKFEGEVKKMEGDESRRERDRLVRAIESREQELKTIENNLCFFNVKSSAGNSMLKEFERKMDRLKDDIAQIKEKIALLDRQKKEAGE